MTHTGTIKHNAALKEFYLLYKIHRGIQQANAGQTVSHEEAWARPSETHPCWREAPG